VEGRWRVESDFVHDVDPYVKWLNLNLEISIAQWLLEVK
jgi:hypothetical protein